MKILFVCALYDPYFGGGAEVTLQQLVEGLAQQGVEVAVLTIGPEPGLHQEMVNGVRVWRAGIQNVYFHGQRQHVASWKKVVWHFIDSYNPFMKSYVRQVIEMEKPDIASCHNLAGWSVSAWDVLQECNVPVVQVLHDQYLLCSRSTMFNAGRICDSPCTSCALLRLKHRSKSNIPVAVVGVSDFILNKLIDEDFFPAAKIRKSLHNVRKPLAKKDFLPRPAQGVIVGFIGTLVESKGIERLLQEFLRVAGADWSLRVAGSGDTAYESFLKTAYADPRITFLGRVAPDDFYPGIDVTVVPSLWDEPLGMVVAESMMHGVPVIATRRGGIPEMLVHGEGGLLFDPDGSGELGASLQRFVDGLAAWRSRSDEIRRAELVRQDMPVWIEQWQEIYQSALMQQRQ